MCDCELRDRIAKLQKENDALVRMLKQLNKHLKIAHEDLVKKRGKK